MVREHREGDAGRVATPAAHVGCDQLASKQRCPEVWTVAKQVPPAKRSPGGRWYRWPRREHENELQGFSQFLVPLGSRDLLHARHHARPLRPHSAALCLRLEDQRGQRRQRDRQRIRSAVSRLRLSQYAGMVSDIAAGVIGRIAVKHFAIPARRRHAQPISVAHDGREVAADQHEIPRLRRLCAGSSTRCRAGCGSRSTRSLVNRSRGDAGRHRRGTRRSSPLSDACTPRCVSHCNRSHCNALSWFHSVHWPNSPPMNSSFLPG